MLMRREGSGALAGQTVSAASGIEIALYDPVGRILETPVCSLPGGRFRDKVRLYRTPHLPKGNIAEPQAWRDQVLRHVLKWSWTAFQLQGDGIPPRLNRQYKEPGHDRFNRNLDDSNLHERVSDLADFIPSGRQRITRRAPWEPPHRRMQRLLCAGSESTYSPIGSTITPCTLREGRCPA